MMKRGSRNPRDGERGYVLLVLLLSVALLSIGVGVIVQGLEFEIRRDREEEMIHRGVEYSRAVRKFIKAFGRYPNSVEELESTNNIRFLRKRYKDPITGKDFKILHLMDLPSSKPLTGAISVTGMVSQQNDASTALNASAQKPAAGSGSEGADPQTSSPDERAASPTDESRPSGSDPTPLTQESTTHDRPTLPRQSSGAGPIVGVASLSKKITIREFDKKNHYNDWQFVYDPSTDRGTLLTTPNQLPGAARLANVQNEQTPFRALDASSSHRNPVDGAQLDPPSSR